VAVAIITLLAPVSGTALEALSMLSLGDLYPDPSLRSLAKAAGSGDVMEIDALLSGGVDVNARGERDTPALYWALRKKNLNGFSRLLERGADPNAKFSDTSIMAEAAKTADSSFLEVALESGGNPNLVAGPSNATPLFATISSSRKASLRKNRDLLLRRGADLNFQDRVEMYGGPYGGMTPVMMAAGLQRYDIVAELLERGADYSIRDFRGRTLATLLEEGRMETFDRRTQAEFSQLQVWLAAHALGSGAPAGDGAQP
jgi:ankyrin repeat protein